MTLCVDDLVLIEIAGVNFLLSKLTDHGEEERKRHDLALENLQKAKDEWNNRRAQKVKIEKELMPWHSNRVFEDQKKRKKRQKNCF